MELVREAGPLERKRHVGEERGKCRALIERKADLCSYLTVAVGRASGHDGLVQLEHSLFRPTSRHNAGTLSGTKNISLRLRTTCDSSSHLTTMNLSPFEPPSRGPHKNLTRCTLSWFTEYYRGTLFCSSCYPHRNGTLSRTLQL
jgi:hypothetical protein